MPANMQDPTFGGYRFPPRPVSRTSSIYSSPPTYPNTPLKRSKAIPWDEVKLPPGFIPNTLMTTPAPIPAKGLYQQTPKTTPRVHVLEVRYTLEDSPETCYVATPRTVDSPKLTPSRMSSPTVSSPGRRSVRFAEEKEMLEEGFTQANKLSLHFPDEKAMEPPEFLPKEAPGSRPPSYDGTDDWFLLNQRLERIKSAHSRSPSLNSLLSPCTSSDGTYLDGCESLYGTPIGGTPARPMNPLPTDLRFREVEDLCPDSPRISLVGLPEEDEPDGAQGKQGGEVDQQGSMQACTPAPSQELSLDEFIDSVDDVDIAVEESTDTKEAASLDVVSDDADEEEDQLEGEDEAEQWEDGSSKATPDPLSPRSITSSMPSPPQPMTPQLPSLEASSIFIQSTEELVTGANIKKHWHSPHTTVEVPLDKAEQEDEEPSLLLAASQDPSEPPSSAPSTPSVFSPTFPSIPLRRPFRQSSSTPRPRPTSCPVPIPEGVETESRLADLMKGCDELEESAEGSLNKILAVYLKLGQELNMLRHVNALNRAKNALGQVKLSREALQNGLEDGLLQVEDDVSQESHFRYLCSLQRTLERLHSHADSIDGKNLDIVLLNKSYEKLHQFEDKLTNLADKFTWLRERLEARQLHEHLTQTTDEVRLQRRALLEGVDRIADLNAKKMYLKEQMEGTPGAKRGSLVV